LENVAEKRYLSTIPARAARKAAFQLLRQVSPDGDAVAELEVAEIRSDTVAVTTKAFSAHRRWLADLPAGVIAFRWTMDIKAIPPSERLKNWLRRFPKNSEEAWRKRPRFGQDDIFRDVFRKRTTEQILKRQMVSTRNRLTEALPRELVLKIWERMTALGAFA